jgi:nuclear RNA export factor
VKHGLQAPGNQVAIAKHYAVIFKIAAELRPEVQTLSLANSNISTGHTITALSRYLPGLSNLSLQGNRLDKYRDIDYFVGRKGGSAPRLDKLKELIFVGNPLVETETKAGRQDQYK